MIRSLLIGILLFVLHLFIPFWGWIMIVPFIIAAFGFKKVGKGFLFSFIAGFIVWGLMTLYLFLTKGEFIGARMAKVLYLNNVWLLVLVTALFGGLLAGLGGGAGTSLRTLFIKPKRLYY